jgi:copper(I)-binding protein
VKKLLETLVETLAALALFTAPAAAAQLSIGDGWFRALPAHLPAGGYFTAHNRGTRDVAITGARSPACGSLMLHRSTDKGGTSRMSMVDSVTVPAGGAVAFAPGGYHLMCANPGPTMKAGGHVLVVLNLSDGSATTVTFAVRGANGK